jgi:hypothetical protein
MIKDVITIEHLTWFSVKLLYKSEISSEFNEYGTDTYEESIILIKARTKEEAILSAKSKGNAEELSYRNVNNEEVRWKFIKVVDVFEITEETLMAGTEVFSRFIVVASEMKLEEMLSRFYQED